MLGGGGVDKGCSLTEAINKVIKCMIRVESKKTNHPRHPRPQTHQQSETHLLVVHRSRSVRLQLSWLQEELAHAHVWRNKQRLKLRRRVKHLRWVARGNDNATPSASAITQLCTAANQSWHRTPPPPPPPNTHCHTHTHTHTHTNAYLVSSRVQTAYCCRHPRTV
jgi:hypothetical protein